MIVQADSVEVSSHSEILHSAYTAPPYPSSVVQEVNVMEARESGRSTGLSSKTDPFP